MNEHWLHDDVVRFTRAALSLLARKQPALAPTGQLTLLPASEGAANYLVHASCSGGADVVVKLRANPLDDASVEARALARLPVDVAPRLLACADAVSLRARSARLADFAALRDLDPRLGGVLVLERLAGSPPRAPLADDDVNRIASCIARVHGVRLETGPRLRTGSSAGALLDLARRLAREIERAGFVDKGSRGDLRRALPLAAKESEKARRLPRVRTLCHGDLRWHNFLLDDERRCARVLDLEHAGVGDPAVDLCLMAARTPLDEHDELRLLDAYLDQRRDPTLLDRYFALRPLVSLVGALAGVVDLSLVARGRRASTEDPSRYLERRRRAASDELADVLRRAGVCPSKARGASGRREVQVQITVPRRRRGAALGRCAVDGTASSGKSVLARAVADLYRAPYFNTGSAYRYAALLALEGGLRADRSDDVERLVARLAQERPRLLDDGGLSVQGRRLEDALYVHEIDLVVARFAALPSVRNALHEALAPARVPRSAVVEGRDIGSAFLPRARHRLFIDAVPRVRAERTLERLGRRLSLDTVQRGLEARDRLDRERSVSPLVVARGAAVLDTSRLSEAAAVARTLAVIERGGAA